MSYERLLERSSQMLDRVENQDWQALIELELDYVGEIERLQQLEANADLSEGEQLVKLALLRELLDQDQAIREGLVARKTELKEAISSMNNQQQLSEYYRN